MHYIHHQHIQPCTPHTRAPARSSRAAGGTLPLRFTGGCTSAIRPHSVRRSWGLPPGALTSVLHAKRHRAEAHGGDAHVARAKLFREERLGLALGVGRGHGHGARPTSQAQATQGGGGQERPHGHERRRGRRERQHPEAPAHRAAVYRCIVSGSCRIKHESCRTHRTAVAHGCATRRMAETQRMCAWWPRPCAALAFPFPRTKPFDFARFPRKEPDAEQKLEQAKALRAELAEALNEGNSAKVAEAADAYLPLAVGVWRAMEQGTTKDGRQISFGVSVEWTSFTYRKPEKFFTMYSMRYEVMMVLICRMLAAGNAAASILEAVQSPAEYENVAKTALQHVKFAGGLAQFIAEEILPLKEVLPYERAPEVHKDLLLSINHLFRATGQSIACRQAQNKGMSQALLGKLFAAAAKLLAQANLILKGDALKNDFKGACLLLRLSPSAPASSYT
eukprot:Tamp_01564.p1 GENE.Tamp_01564~~Tamp_01564.p1  ORF type:complete len:449 (-),score=61.13 Tamp_01564:132-1478(-)